MSEFPSWISAIGSAGSLLGFAAYVWIMMLNRLDHEQLRREEEAQGVAGWLDNGHRHDAESPYVLCVHNSGTSPVFNCTATYRLTEGADGEGIRTEHLHIVPPNITAVRALPEDADEFDAESLYSPDAVPRLRFTDSAAGHWERDADGVLRNLDRRRLRRRPKNGHGGSGRDEYKDSWERSSQASTS